MRRLEGDKDFFKGIIESRIIETDSILYTISEDHGSGTMKSYSVMPGVEIIYNDFNLSAPLNNMLNIETECIEITYCLKGQVEIQMANGKYAYMTNEDISLFGYNTKALSCDFSLKPFCGITIMIYIKDFIKSLNNMFDTDEFDEKEFFEKVVSYDNCIITHANQSINHIFKELYIIPDKYKSHLMKIKTVELLLYLMNNLDYKQSETVYFSKTSMEKVKEARKIILDKIDEHITIKDISEIVNMNTTDLEKGFKSIFGDTIFSYSRKCKMAKAKQLLEDNDKSVLEVALCCGYSSGGKFAKAFKETFGMRPNEYRRSVKKG